MARLPPNHPSKRRNRNRGGQNDIGADSSLSNESNSSSFFPSNSSRGRTESVPTLNVSGTVTPPASVELERDRTPIRTPNLLGGCSGTISTPTGSRNATTAPRVLRPRENVVRSRCLAPLNLAATPNSSSSSEGHDLAIFARANVRDVYAGLTGADGEEIRWDFSKGFSDPCNTPVNAAIIDRVRSTDTATPANIIRAPMRVHFRTKKRRAHNMANRLNEKVLKEQRVR
ncbi:hypothetical protein P5673_033404, partial [Acropora cervicornis]